MTGSGARLPVCRWPRLIMAAVEYVDIEQSATRKRAEDYATFFLSVLRCVSLPVTSPDS